LIEGREREQRKSIPWIVITVQTTIYRKQSYRVSMLSGHHEEKRKKESPYGKPQPNLLQFASFTGTMAKGLLPVTLETSRGQA
jgi:hypothetical protein